MSNIPADINAPGSFKRFIRVAIKRFIDGSVDTQDDLTDYRLVAMQKPVTDSELRRMAVGLIELAASSGRSIEIRHVIDHEDKDDVGNHVIIISPNIHGINTQKEKLNATKD